MEVEGICLFKLNWGGGVWYWQRGEIVDWLFEQSLYKLLSFGEKPFYYLLLAVLCHYQ